jgi:hypothetical protein
MAKVEKVNIAVTKVNMMRCFGFVHCKHAVSTTGGFKSFSVSQFSDFLALSLLFHFFPFLVTKKEIFFCQKRIIRFRLKAHPFHDLTCPSTADCYQLTTWDTINKLHFLCNLRMSQIS